jgi:hypothetical protein
MLIGAIRPALLLPQSFAAGLAHPTSELEAIWLHELAHLRRRDYLTNLVCRIATLPIAYHPATYAVQQRIRQTREMVCDEMAAAAMQSPLGYARCLVGLAHTMHATTTQIEAVGMFNHGILEERIMHLTTSKPAVNARTRTLRLASAAAITLILYAAPAIFHVTPTLAQTQLQQQAQVPQAAELSQPEQAAAPLAPAVASTAEQSPEPPQPAVPAKARKPAAPASEASLARKEAAEAQASADSTSQLEDARKHLDDAANAYGALATKASHTAASDPDLRQQFEEARRRLSDATRAFNDQIARTVDSRIREKEFNFESSDLSRQMAEV